MPDLGIEVQGLREFTRELKRAQQNFGTEMRVANKKVADAVATRAQSTARGQGGVAAKTAPSIRSLAQQTRAQVSLGGGAYPFAMGAEFGSFRYRQFKPWRGSGSDAGYFLYETIRDMGRAGDIERAFMDAVDDAVKGAFPS